ncbi:hypothetical protein JCM24511_03311 [Saitozyma sp. JCM 24511]|nr:hypothetical protein JCM24511_03311 [Saitozyma sp. JCM 24511]
MPDTTPTPNPAARSGSGTRIIRVAAVQAASVAYDLDSSLTKARKLVADAKEGGAGMVVLPEAFLGGYPRGMGFEIGRRTGEQREWFGRYVKAGVVVPPNPVGKDYSGATLDDEYAAFAELCAIARDSAVYLSIGVVERAPHGSATLWCTNLLFSPDGVLLSRHRKLQPTAAERVVWSQGEGTNGPAPGSGPGKEEGGGNGGSGAAGMGCGEDNMAVVPTGVGRVGGLICWENYMPLARYVLYKKGVEIYVAPTADARPTWLPTMQHIAQEGRCFVVSANQFHTSDDFPIDYPPRVALDPSRDAAVTGAINTNGMKSHGEVPAEVWSRGGSCIVGPLGEVLAGPIWDQEGIIFADLDMDSLLGARLDFEAAGHYAREELMLSLLSQRG